MRVPHSLTAVAIGALGLSTASAQYSSDNFNTNTSANYNIAQTSDAVVTFAYDYSAMGIPVAPNTPDSTTLGVKFETNLSAGATQGITLHTLQSYTGDIAVTFDAWVNANGPFPGGGTGSTEFLTAGVGGDGVTVNQGGASGMGAWFAASGEGGSSRDYRAYKNGGEQFAESGQFSAGGSSQSGGAHNNFDPYYAGFLPVDVGNLPVQGANAAGGFPQQNGSTHPGCFGFAWHEVRIAIDADGGTAGAPSVTWSIDGLTIATLDAGIGSPFVSDGSVTIGYMDIFTSISDNAALSFGLIDNLVISARASATNYGSNPAHPTNGNALLVNNQIPALGGNADFSLQYAAGGLELGNLYIGSGRVNVPIFDGNLLVFPFITTVAFATSPPTTNFMFPIPLDPFLAGATVTFQAVVLDSFSPGTPAGLVFSDGLELRAGI